MKLKMINKDPIILKTEKTYIEDNVEIHLENESLQNIIPSNLLNGKTILGVEGSLLEESTIEPQKVLFGEIAYKKDGSKFIGEIKKFKGENNDNLTPIAHQSASIDEDGNLNIVNELDYAYESGILKLT